MAAAVLGSVRSWSGSRDSEGHREYTVKLLVQAGYNDGPFTVMNASGLYAIGSFWNLGNDSDPWAFCLPSMKVTIHKEQEGDKNRFWTVEQTFTTRPIPSKRCQDTQIEDPLAEPDRVSGTFVKERKEATHDRYGNRIKNSAHEPIRGQLVEFDSNRPTVHIEQNVSTLELSTFSQMIDTVNDSTLWGLSTRKIKLSNVAWERKLFGVCDFYYTRALDFDIKYEGWDNVVPDEGTMVLNGQWGDSADAGTAPDEWMLIPINGAEPNPDNPSHFCRYKDRSGEPARVILDGSGRPASQIIGSAIGAGTDTSGGPATITIEYYEESNFLLLGIPTSF